MELALKNSELPVLMVYDLDASWDSHEAAECATETRRLVAALRRHGHSVVTKPVTDVDLATQLDGLDPLAEEPARAGAQRGEHEVVVLEGRQHQHAHVGE